ncbi:MAG: hypothetical protein ABSD57_00420 [Verrucomicrobiota bacterium]
MQMLTHHLTRIRRACLPLWIWLVCVAGFAPFASAQPEVYGKPDSSAFIRIPQDADDWTRHFRIGALVGMNISANFSMKGQFNVSGNNPANGIYDDGYVRVDSTGDVGGGTTYWGYQSASQYNGQTLTMHATTSFSASSSANEDGGLFPGFDMAYGDNLWYWKHARVGWELGFDLLPISITDNHPISATVNQSTYTFNVGNVVIPGAPYYGNPSGSSAMIPNTPPTVTSQPLYNQTVTGTRSLDVMLYAVRLGPSFYWDLTEHVGMSVGAGPAIGIVSGDYKYDETITINGVGAHNTGRFGTTDMVYGGYVNATVMYHAVANGDIYAGVQYSPMSDANFSGAGREGRLNLGGQFYFTIGINWPF